MVADPKITLKPIILVSTEKLEEVIPVTLPSCAMTRALAKKAREEPKDCKKSRDLLVLPPVELDKVPFGYYVRNGVLMRKWRPPNAPAAEEWSVVHKIVVPKVYQSEILKLAQESSMGGYLGINKTYRKITKHFYWPQIWDCVTEFCKTCHICQMVGKPNPLASL